MNLRSKVPLFWRRIMLVFGLRQWMICCCILQMNRARISMLMDLDGHCYGIGTWESRVIVAITNVTIRVLECAAAIVIVGGGSVVTAIATKHVKNMIIIARARVLECFIDIAWT